MAIRRMLTGDPVSVTNDGNTLWKVRGGWSMCLTGVEGCIQFVEDLAEQAMLDAGVPRANIPSWPEARRSGISLSGLPPLRNRAAGSEGGPSQRAADVRTAGGSGQLGGARPGSGLVPRAEPRSHPVWSTHGAVAARGNRGCPAVGALQAAEARAGRPLPGGQESAELLQEPDRR
jgi:hypothetical protein